MKKSNDVIKQVTVSDEYGHLLARVYIDEDDGRATLLVKSSVTVDVITKEEENEELLS